MKNQSIIPKTLMYVVFGGILVVLLCLCGLMCDVC